MPYEIPNSVSLVIGSNDTQLGFVRKALIQAAREAGLPLLEQVDFAISILRLPINPGEAAKLLDISKQEGKPSFRLIWNGKDPSPKDHTIEIQDWEFNKRRGKNFGYTLSSIEKEELKRRQIHYQLDGGTLGSNIEAPANDTIIIDLNLIYEKENYNATTAESEFGGYITDAIQIYGQLEIKFNISSWTPGNAKFVYGNNDSLNATITEGAKAGFYNVIFGKLNNSNDRLSYTMFSGESKPLASFIFKPGLGANVFVDRGLRTHSLAHELGHVFGITGSEISIVGYEPPDLVRNILTDQQVDSAITRILSGKVKKGIDWKKNGLVLPDVSGNVQYFTVFDKLRAGARGLAGAI